MPVAGVLLAAGAGRRYGRPKALVDTGDGPWVLRALHTLEAVDGLDPLVVVVGAAAQEVTALLPSGVRAVHNPLADTGMGSSLRAGLAALDPAVTVAALIHLVDLPDVDAPVVFRLLEHGPVTPATLRRATYQGRPGHPVLLGADHWPAIAATAVADRGARDHLRTHRVELVECGDMAHGRDQDRPAGSSA